MQRRSGEAGQRVLAGSRPGGGFRFAALRPAAVLDLPRCARRAFYAPLWGALDVPPSAAEIAGSRPCRRADFLRAQEVGGRRALKGTFALGGLPGLRPERATRDGRSRALRPATPA